MKQGIHLFGVYVSWCRIFCVLLLGAVAVLTATTIGEFAVSVHNRYSVYPPGTDTNMYGNSAIGQMLIVFIAAVAIGYALRKKFDVGMASVGVIIFFVLAILSSQVKSFIPTDWCRYELTMYSCDAMHDTGKGG